MEFLKRVLHEFPRIFFQSFFPEIMQNFLEEFFWKLFQDPPIDLHFLFFRDLSQNSSSNSSKNSWKIFQENIIFGILLEMCPGILLKIPFLSCFFKCFGNFQKIPFEILKKIPPVNFYSIISDILPKICLGMPFGVPSRILEEIPPAFPQKFLFVLEGFFPSVFRFLQKNRLG